jgi:hypothetical protein
MKATANVKVPVALSSSLRIEEKRQRSILLLIREAVGLPKNASDNEGERVLQCDFFDGTSNETRTFASHDVPYDRQIN